MNRQKILYDIENLGYTISIKKIDETNNITFNGKYSKEHYILPRSYSTEYTNQEIKEDCVFDLMEWAGLHYESRLTYKI